MKEFFINNKNKILMILAVIIIIAASIVITIQFNSKKISKVEELKIKEISSNFENFLEYIEYDGDKLEKYIVYVLKSSCDLDNICTLSYKDIADKINNIFNEDVTEDQINKYGVTIYMVDKNISVDSQENKYTIINNKLSYEEISHKKVYKYILSNIKKNSDDVYILTYNKYVISDPYKVLEYFENNNNQLENEKNEVESLEEKEKLEEKKVDTTDISNYLTGKENEIIFKKYINSNNVLKFGKQLDDITLTLVLVNNKLLINN